jgi:hypothetical protein
VKWALLDSVDLFRDGHSCWAGDVAIALSRLPIPGPTLVRPEDLLSIPAVQAIERKVEEVVEADLQFNIDFLQSPSPS